MGRPLVSVNICTWRPRVEYFTLAVQSIVNQSFSDYEVVIVEDPSDVDGRAVLGDLAHHPKIRYVQNANRTGLLAQKNQALHMSRGELVAILDHDDVAAHKRLEQQVSFLDTNPDISVVGSWIRAIDEHGKEIGVRKYPTDPITVRHALRRFSPIAHPASMFRKEHILSVGGYTWTHKVDPLGLVSDYDLWCRLSKNGFRMANIPEVLLDYRLHAAAQKAATTRTFLKATLIIKQRYFWNEFTFVDWVRYILEACLIAVPPSVTWLLFKRLTYRPTILSTASTA